MKVRGCSTVAGDTDRRLCRPCDCADLRCESVVLQGVRPRQVGTITTRRQGSAGFRSRVAGWTWIGATERGEGRRDSNSPVYTPKQPATRSVATLVLGRGAGSASLARRWQTSGRATGLCRPTGGGSLNPQAIQPQGRHNQKVGTIGVVPTSAQRRLCASHALVGPWNTPPICVRRPVHFSHGWQVRSGQQPSFASRRSRVVTLAISARSWSGQHRSGLSEIWEGEATGSPQRGTATVATSGARSSARRLVLVGLWLEHWDKSPPRLPSSGRQALRLCRHLAAQLVQLFGRILAVRVVGLG